jgi:outer membrane protein TolC
MGRMADWMASLGWTGILGPIGSSSARLGHPASHPARPAAPAFSCLALAILLFTIAPRYATAQTSAAAPSSPFQGSVPTGSMTGAPLTLSLGDAVARGLATNLGVLESAEATRAARAQWLSSLSNLLPNVTAKISRTTEQVDLAALGFTNAAVPGIPFPAVLGPFSFVDARAYVSQRVFNWSDINSLRSASAARRASEYSYKAARDLVVQATANAYLLAVSDLALVDATRAQVETATASLRQVTDQNRAGLAASIDVLRARVQLQTEQQRLIAASNQLAVDKLTLARVIGLPNGQVFTLADNVPYSELGEVSVEQALTRAYSARADYQSRGALVRAAELTRKAAVAEYYPSAGVDVNYGDIGATFGNSHGTVSVVGSVSIPVFQGTSVRARVLQADAALKQARDQLADLGGKIDYEVRTAFLNLTSARDLVAVARSNIDLASQTLTQARDRFAAGVADNLEVVQAQESVATANQSYISSLYSYNSAKVSLAQAIGVAEQSALTYLGVK